MLDCHWHNYVTHLIISELIYITYIFPHKKIWWNLNYKMWSYWLNTMIKISAKEMLQWCPLPDWPYLYQYVTLCNDIHIAGKPRCKAFKQCLRHCIWFSIYGDMDQSIHIATSLQHFFCSLYILKSLQNQVNGCFLLNEARYWQWNTCCVYLLVIPGWEVRLDTYQYVASDINSKISNKFTILLV